ncbi:hypothetical protein B4N89_40940 [Embleya scabrispora]|uniref:Uncharacterized protein n=1 Tax=Embleya scabrispora TaxID=159449 RepID=A0A1T3NJT8_9ACTN|nr:hypothetical protein B4N89_40940 [Embleya scabrispora]
MPLTSFLDAVPIGGGEKVVSQDVLFLARTGRMDAEVCRRLVIAEYQTREAEARAYAALLRCHRQEVPQRFFAYAHGRSTHHRHRLLTSAAPALCLTPADLRGASTTLAVRHLDAFLACVARRAGPGEAALTIRTGAALWSRSCAMLAETLDGRPDVPAAFVAHLNAHRDNCAPTADGVLRVIEYGLAAGEPRENITRSALMIESLWRAWWRSVAGETGARDSPDPAHTGGETPPSQRTHPPSRRDRMNPEQLVEAMKPDVERFVRGNEMVERALAKQVHGDQFKRLLLAEYQCQEAELSSYGQLVARHRHEDPARLFSFILHTIAEARRLLREGAPSVGIADRRIPAVPVDQGLYRVVRDLSWPGMHAGAAEAALYLHTDLSTWCTLFSRIADAAEDLPDVPGPVIAYMRSWGDRPPPEVAEGTLTVLEYGLSQGEEPDRILHTARQLGALLDGYWNYVVGD